MKFTGEYLNPVTDKWEPMNPRPGFTNIRPDVRIQAYLVAHPHIRVTLDGPDMPEIGRERWSVSDD